MAGRGRGATLPAWMTNGGGGAAAAAVVESLPAPAPNQFANPVESRSESRKVDRRSRSRSRDREDRNRDRDRGDRRDRDRDRDGRDRRRERSKSPAEEWKPRKSRQSNFDVRPPAGVELPPIGVSNPVGIPNSCLSFSSTPLEILKDPLVITPTYSTGSQPIVLGRADVSPATRHARRLYAGGIPPTVTEMEVRSFFSEVISRALGANNRWPGPPVVGVYLNLEKCYAFVELPGIEMATACMKLDGLRWEHHTGNCILRIRRPNDYRPELVQHMMGPIPELDMDYLISMGVTAPDGPGRIFIGGLPYGIADADVVELLNAFGPLKSFHQVREAGLNSPSKGYGFCEYFSKEISDTAVAGLNGLPLGDKTLTVRYATGATNAPPVQQTLSTHFGINAPPSAAPMAQNLIMAPPTRVIKLSNMVTSDDLRDDNEFIDIKEDVRIECATHGRVLSVTIPRTKDGYPPNAEGHVFVEFSTVNEAQAANAALTGRKFDNRAVIVQYFDETNYARGYFA